MSKEDLIPFNAMPREKALEMNRNGGLARSEDKVNAQRLRRIKERMKSQGMTDKDQLWMLEKLENRSAYAVDIALFVEEIKLDMKLTNVTKPMQKIMLGELMTKAAKFVHGDKLQTINTNFNVNITQEEWAKRLINDEEVNNDTSF